VCRGGAGARRRRWPVRRGCEAGRGRHRGRRARWPSSGREKRAGGCWDRTRRFRVGLRKTAQVLSRAAISSSVSIGTGFSGGAGISMPTVGRDLQLSFSHQPSAEPGASRAGACRRWRDVRVPRDEFLVSSAQQGDAVIPDRPQRPTSARSGRQRSVTSGMTSPRTSWRAIACAQSVHGRASELALTLRPAGGRHRQLVRWDDSDERPGTSAS